MNINIMKFEDFMGAMSMWNGPKSLKANSLLLETFSDDCSFAFNHADSHTQHNRNTI